MGFLLLEINHDDDGGGGDDISFVQGDQ